MTKYTITADFIAMLFCLFTNVIFLKRSKRMKDKSSNIEKYRKNQIANLALIIFSIALLVIASVMNLSGARMRLNAVGVTFMLSFLLVAGLIMPAISSTFTIHLYNRVHKKKRKGWNIICFGINALAIFLSLVIIGVFIYNLMTGDFSNVKDFSSLITEINFHVGTWFTFTELLVTSFLWLISTFVVLINSFWMGLLAINANQLSIANRKNQEFTFKQSANLNIDVLALESDFNFGFKPELVDAWKKQIEEKQKTKAEKKAKHKEKK